jgi:hypothetical protein
MVGAFKGGLDTCRTCLVSPESPRGLSTSVLSCAADPIDRFLVSLVRATVKVDWIWNAIAEAARKEILDVAAARGLKARLP